jgi:hypothetical protein
MTGLLSSVALFGVVFVVPIIAECPSTGRSTLLLFDYLEVTHTSRFGIGRGVWKEKPVKSNTLWVGIGWLLMVVIVTLALVAASWPIVGQISQLAAVLNLG